VFEDAVRNAQPAHIVLLRRGAVEQAEKAPAEIVVGLGRFVFCGLLLQPLVAVERMKLAFELFRIGELAAGFEDAVLRPQRRGIWPERFHGSGGAARRSRRRTWRHSIAVCRTQTLRDLQSGHEAFEITLLLWFEIARHRLFR